MYRILITLIVLLPSVANSANFFVDPFRDTHSDETWDGVDGHAYSSSAPNSPAPGTGYSNVQAAVNAMSGGDDLYLRGGEYDNPQLTNGTTNTVTLDDDLDGTANNYTSIQSFPGEWAILDGENNCDDGGGNRPRGLLSSGASGARATDYLLIERVEIKRGANQAGTWASGLCLSGAGLTIRYCYIHENYAINNNNPSGIRGYGWVDVLIEFNVFEDNGVSDANGPSYNSENSNHITVFSEYDSDTISDRGYQASDGGVRKNIIRYNYFENGGALYKVKGVQLFTGRRSGAFSSDYSHLGDTVHHNIVVGAYSSCLLVRGDFTSVHNNICDASGGGIRIGHNHKMQGVVLYNNTLLDSTSKYPAIYWHGHPDNNWPWEDSEWHAFDYNNIISKGGNTPNEYSGGAQSEWHVGRRPLYDAPSYDHLEVRNNYIHEGDDEYVMSLFGDNLENRYTESTWEALFPLNNIYTGNADPPTLFQATSGSSKYRINTEHIAEGTTSAGSAGYTGNHPYKGSSVTIPSYLGAVNPDDNDWVDGVMGLNVSYFINLQGGTTPGWIEGQSPKTCYLDEDGDGYSDGTSETAESCSTNYLPADQLISTSGDCNDSNPSIHPGASEIPDNGIDEDCNGLDQSLSLQVPHLYSPGN